MKHNLFVQGFSHSGSFLLCFFFVNPRWDFQIQVSLKPLNFHKICSSNLFALNREVWGKNDGRLECTIGLRQKLWTQVQVNSFQVIWPAQWNISCLDELQAAWVGLWVVRKKTKIKKSLFHLKQGGNPVEMSEMLRTVLNVSGFSCHR